MVENVEYNNIHRNEHARIAPQACVSRIFSNYIRRKKRSSVPFYGFSYSTCQQLSYSTF